MRKLVYTLLYSISTLLLGCSVEKYIPEGEQLYLGHSLEIEGEKELPRLPKLRNELEEVIKVKPNTKILGTRPLLWIHYKAKDTDKEKGFRYWLKYKVGEKPVYFSAVDVPKTERLLTNRLYTIGHFKGYVNTLQKREEKSVKVNYQVYPLKGYRIKRVVFPDSNSVVEGFVAKTKDKSLLDSTAHYDFKTLRAERDRIDEALKEEGFYYFSPDYILFKADSAEGTNTVDVYVTLKKDMPAKAKNRYKLGEVLINTNFAGEGSNVNLNYDSTERKRFTIIGKPNFIKPRPIARATFLREGQYYSTENYDRTLTNLTGLGVFRYAAINLTEMDSGRNNLLRANIDLTPGPIKSILTEFRMVSKSNNFAGPGFRASWRNRNFLKGAEQFSVNFNGAFETLISGELRGLNSFEVGGDVQLLVPSFLLPFRVKLRKTFTQKTNFKLGYSLLNRVQFYRLNSTTASLGYIWDETSSKQHILQPLYVNYLHLGNVSENFQAILNDNPLLRRSFENQLILGGTYSYFNTFKAKETDRHGFFFNTNVKIAGNTASLVNQLTGSETTFDNPSTIFGLRFSQFTKVDIDGRYYWRFLKGWELANRVIVGGALAYGNSKAIPYVEQFFAGGNNSIRAFQVRSLGPGTYRSADSLRGAFFFDQSGDIKIEANTELRFPIISVLKGAFFIDAGNVWLARADTTRPGGEFNRNTFLSQMAIGSGVGLRLDITYFVFRLDLGIPLRIPSNESGNRWVGDNINFGSAAYRRENLVLNIAIGYPF